MTQQINGEGVGAVDVASRPGQLVRVVNAVGHFVEYVVEQVLTPFHVEPSPGASEHFGQSQKRNNHNVPEFAAGWPEATRTLEQIR